MQCPVDGTTLVMSDRQGIEIDYCPQCRGVWLDRGEIDKIVERSTNQGGQQHAPTQNNSRPQSQQQYRDYDDDNNYRNGDHHNQKHHKKESWFGELFD